MIRNAVRALVRELRETRIFWLLPFVLSTMTVAFLAAVGRSTWYVGVQLIAVYAIFAVTLYLLPAG